MIKDAEEYKKFRLLGQKLFESAQGKYQGHPLYEVFGKKLRCSFKVIQMLNSIDIVDFQSEGSMILYMLETDGNFILLYPKLEFYKKVWAAEENERGLQESTRKIIKEKQREGQLNPDSCKILLEAFTRHSDEVGDFIENLDHSRKDLMKRLDQGFKTSESEMVKYQKQIDYCIEKIAKSEVPSEELGELMKNLPIGATNYVDGIRNIEFSVNGGGIGEIVKIGQLLDLKVKGNAQEVVREHKGREYQQKIVEEEKGEVCHICKEMGEVIDFECECKVCIKCIEKNKIKSTFHCLSCDN